MAFHVFLFLLVLFLLLSGAALASVLAPSSAFPLTSREQTHQGCTGAGAGSPHYEAVVWRPDDRRGSQAGCEA
jgi:hypothetical protein